MWLWRVCVRACVHGLPVCISVNSDFIPEALAMLSPHCLWAADLASGG